MSCRNPGASIAQPEAQAHRANRGLKHYFKSGSGWGRVADQFGLTGWGALLPILLAALGTAHILFRTSAYGAAIGADSVGYLSIAENLLAGHGLQDHRGGPIPPWPPVFPLLLAGVAAAAGIEPSEAARLVNAAAFGLCILLSSLWLRRTLRSPVLAAGFSCIVATSYYLSHAASHVMSEATFILFVLLALMCMERFSSRGAPALVLAAAFSGLAASTRYAGCALIFTGVLLLLARQGAPLHSRLKQVAAYGALSAAPLAAVLMRNRWLFGTWDLPRPHWTGQPALDALHQIARVVERAVVPENAPEGSGYLLWAMAALLALGSAAMGIRALFQPAARQSAAFRAALPFGAFALVYLVCMAVIAAWHLGENVWINPRYHLPAYLPLLLAASVFLDRFLRLETTGRMAVAKGAAAAVLLLGGAAHVGLTVRENIEHTLLALESGYHGKSYNSAFWDASETIRWLKQNPAQTKVFANRYGLLHALLALETGTVVQGKYPSLEGDAAQLARQIEEEAPEGALVVWLHDGEDWYQYDDQALRSQPGLALVAEHSDGLIFRVLRK